MQVEVTQEQYAELMRLYEDEEEIIFSPVGYEHPCACACLDLSDGRTIYKIIEFVPPKPVANKPIEYRVTVVGAADVSTVISVMAHSRVDAEEKAMATAKTLHSSTWAFMCPTQQPIKDARVIAVNELMKEQTDV